MPNDLRKVPKWREIRPIRSPSFSSRVCTLWPFVSSVEPFVQQRTFHAGVTLHMTAPNCWELFSVNRELTLVIGELNLVEKENPGDSRFMATNLSWKRIEHASLQPHLGSQVFHVEGLIGLKVARPYPWLLETVYKRTSFMIKLCSQVMDLRPLH